MLSRWIKTVLFWCRASLAQRISSYVVLLSLYSTAAILADRLLLHDRIAITSSLHALLGTVLGLLLVFRTNTAYARWWEGRQLWGQLVNDTRNLAIKLRLFDTIGPADARHMARLLVNFAKALKEHLREGIRPRQLSVYQGMEVLSKIEPRHIPANIAFMIREKIRHWRTRGQIDGYDELMLDVHARALMDICGGCERIKKTPLARSYLMFIRQCIALYVITLPWALVHDFQYWTIPAVAIIAYFLIGLELIAEDVEEPFGRSEDDLALDEICHGIDTTVTEIINTPLRERSEPPAAAPEVRKPV